MFANNELKIMVPTCPLPEGIFKLVPASLLSLSDDFLKYRPHTKKEATFMYNVQQVITTGIHDFWCSTIDPSFDNDKRICYQHGMKPATRKSYEWWVETAQNFCPERNSRLGTTSEYIAFLAVLIKELVASGKSLEWAWNAVCNDSTELGHYRSSNNAKRGSKRGFEATGSRAICGWYDLANTLKILAKDVEPHIYQSIYYMSEKYPHFWVAGGWYGSWGHNNPLVWMGRSTSREAIINGSTGWIVLT